MQGNRQILVHVGDVVHVLVPYFAGGNPWHACGLEDVQVALIGMAGAETSAYNDSRTPIFIQTGHYGVLHYRAFAKRQ